jgi:hypothetical protein
MQTNHGDGMGLIVVRRRGGGIQQAIFLSRFHPPWEDLPPALHALLPNDVVLGRTIATDKCRYGQCRFHTFDFWKTPPLCWHSSTDVNMFWMERWPVLELQQHPSQPRGGPVPLQFQDLHAQEVLRRNQSVPSFYERPSTGFC